MLSDGISRPQLGAYFALVGPQMSDGPIITPGRLCELKYGGGVARRMFCVCRMRREGLSRSSSSFPLPSFVARLTPFRETGALFDHAVTCAPMKMSQSVDRLPPSSVLPFPTLHPEGFFPLGMVQLWNNEASNSGVGSVFELGGVIGMAVVFRLAGVWVSQSGRHSCNFLGREDTTV